MSCECIGALRSVPFRKAGSSPQYLEQLGMDAFDHLVCFDETSRVMTIYRVHGDGTRTLFTTAALPETRGWTAASERFAMQLGENLLLDSPAARRLLDI